MPELRIDPAQITPSHEEGPRRPAYHADVDPHDESPTPDINMKLSTSERTLTPVAISKRP